MDFTNRKYDFEIRAEENDDGEGVIVGRPIVFDARTNIGGVFDEIIERGALDKTDLTDVRFLVNHDTSKIPLARSRRNNGNSTMHLTTDEQGMAIRVNLDIENNTEARNLYSAIKRGDVSGMSFMFGVDDEEWEDLTSEMPTRHIRSISKVVEVSAVTFPAYEQTSIDARDKNALENAKSTLEKVKDEKRELELLKLKALYLH